MVTYNDVMLARMVFEKFWEEDLPFKIAEKVENFLLETNQFREKVEQKRRELLEKYSEKNEDGSVKLIPVDDKISIPAITDESAFIKEFNEFLDSTIEYNFDEDYFFTDDEIKLLKCSPREVKNVKWYTCKCTKETL